MSVPYLSSTGVNSLSLPGSDSVEYLHTIYNTIVIIRVPSIYQLGKMDQNDQCTQDI